MRWWGVNARESVWIDRLIAVCIEKIRGSIYSLSCYSKHVYQCITMALFIDECRNANIDDVN